MLVPSIGKRLQQLRKTLKIKQEEITGDQVTRNLISIIENDKTNLTPKVAEIISSEINRICLERNIDFQVTPETLLETEDSILDKAAVKMVEDIISGTFDLRMPLNRAEVIELDTQLRTHGLYDRSFELINACEDKSFRIDASLSYYYAKRANELLNLLSDHSHHLSNYLKITFNTLVLEKYDEALFYCDVMLKTLTPLKPDDEYKIRINKNLALSKLGENAKAEEEIDSILKLKGLSKENRYKAIISKSNKLYERGSYKEAHKILLPLLDETSDQLKHLVFSNLLDIERKSDLVALKKMTDRAIHFLNDQETDGMGKHYEYLCKLCFKLSLAMLTLENEEGHWQWLEKALALPSSMRPSQERRAISEWLIGYCEENSSIKHEELLHKMISDMIADGSLHASDKIVWRLLEFYAERKLIKKTRELIKVTIPRLNQ